MVVDYDLKKLSVKRQTIIGQVIEVELKKKNSNIILLDQKKNDKIMFKDMSDHPYQIKAVLIGPGCEEYFPKGIKENDILLLERDFDPSRDLINLKGEMYIRVSVLNVLAVRVPGKTLNK